MKTCYKCQKAKLTTDFYKNALKRGGDGLQSSCKACQKEYNAAYLTSIRRQVLEILGGKCAWCGFNDFRALQVDHIEGGGSQEVRKIGNRKVYLNIIKNGTEGYQCLCANCNWIKRHENGETGNYFSNML